MLHSFFKCGYYLSYHVVAPMCFLNCLQVELICRVVTLLVQTHYNQLHSTPAARPVLGALTEIHPRVKVIGLPAHSFIEILQG